MPIGTVKFFNGQKGFGFIAQDDGGPDTFVHATAVERAGLNGLQQRQRLSYDIATGKTGKSEAVNLREAEENPNASNDAGGGAAPEAPPAE